MAAHRNKAGLFFAVKPFAVEHLDHAAKKPIMGLLNDFSSLASHTKETAPCKATF